MVLELNRCFIRKVNQLDTSLQTFTNAVGQLGSSVAILSSADDLRDCLTELLKSFRSNAVLLFQGSDKEPADIPKLKRFASRYHRPGKVEDLPATIPGQMDSLGSNPKSFVQCLNQIPEFTDQAVNASTALFRDDLVYWGSCLKEHEGNQ